MSELGVNIKISAVCNAPLPPLKLRGGAESGGVNNSNSLIIFICMMLLASFALGIVVGEKVTKRRLSASVSRVVPDNQIAGMGTDTPVRPEYDK